MKLFATKGLALAAGVWATQAWALQVPGPLVDTAWLAKNQDDVVVLDVRRDKQSFIRKMGGSGEVAGVQACGAKGGGGGVSGHIPDSALIEWKEIAVKDKANGVELHDMVPSKGDFEKLMQKSGVDQGSAVVIATPGDGMPSIADGTRLYWTLKYFGHDNVALLDGGVAKWGAEKRKIEYGRTRPSNGNWSATTERRDMLATLEDVQQGMRDGVQLVDIRTPDYYLGLKHKAKKVKGKGHIPGAKNMPFMVIGKESPEGTTLYSTDELRRISTELGLDPGKPIITHCNTGHLASSGWFVMHELLGNKDARLYVGSMNEWSADPARPVSNRSE
ncbi:MAG: rhodanese-like domain-containing protein [Gammaproteobacteria bacterium]|nr:rhodanese-like domain-containing protein [Gammaproteobacteria bacterium]